MGSKTSRAPPEDSGEDGRRGSTSSTRSLNSSRSGSTASSRRKPSMWTQLKNGYGDLVNAIIRPPRASYEVSDLGPASFRVSGRQFERRELQIRNPRGLALECS